MDAAPPPAEPGAGSGTTNGVVFWPLATFVVLADVITKAMAVYTLHPVGLPHEVFGDTVRLTLVYNPGAAFGLSVGPHSRWVFLALTVVVLTVLWRLYTTTRDRDNVRTASLALVSGGALGNAIDRVRSEAGVVDFIDIGAGLTRWPTFNLADVAVSTGAFMLAWVLWGEEQRATSPVAAEAAESP